MPKIPRRKNTTATIPVIPYNQCFAKSNGNKAGITVYDHCRIAGKISMELVHRLPDVVRQLLPASFPFQIAVHDTGKISPGFLKHCCNNALLGLSRKLAEISFEASGLNKNHAEIGEAAFRNWAIAKGKSLDWLRWAESIGFHHGRRSLPGRDESWSYGGSDWSKQRFLFLEKMFQEFPEDLPVAGPDPVQMKILTGLLCISDWIASDEYYFPCSGLPLDFDVDAAISSALHDSGWHNFSVHENLTFKDVFTFDPLPFQTDFFQCVQEPGLYILEAPMGLGKTEAALFAAYKLMEKGMNQGLYFGLPTRLTSNRIHQRVEKFQQAISSHPDYVRLIHGQSWMESSLIEFQVGKSWFHPKKRALLTGFGVGTIDQALLSVMRVKHHFIRTLGLAGKVVILDEVHSYDAYTGRLLDLLVRELLDIGCTVIVLSATLTSGRRSELLKTNDIESAYPVITFKTKSRYGHVIPLQSAHKEVAIEFNHGDFDALIDRVSVEAENGANVLWILNTVNDSQEAYRILNSYRRQDQFKVGLLHSRFQGFRREELENHWMNCLGKDGNRPRGSVLIATQVVEQSVDIDADILITDLAPSDMILQRIGRLWRHSRPDRSVCEPTVILCTPSISEMNREQDFLESIGKSQYVYAPYVLFRTAQVWNTIHRITLPDQIRETIESTYSDRIEDMDWVKNMKNDVEKIRSEMRDKALGITALYSNEDDEDAVSTRYGDRRSVDFLLIRSCDDIGSHVTLGLLDDSQPVYINTNEKNFNIARRLHRQLIPVPVHKGFKSNTPPWVKRLIYGDVHVLKVVGDICYSLDEKETEYRYHPNIGLFINKINHANKIGEEDEFD